MAGRFREHHSPGPCRSDGPANSCSATRGRVVVGQHPARPSRRGCARTAGRTAAADRGSLYDHGLRPRSNGVVRADITKTMQRSRDEGNRSGSLGVGGTGRRSPGKLMKSTQWLLHVFAASSLVSSFIVMEEGAMPVLFLLVALIASTCAQSLHGVHQRLDHIERKLDKEAE